MNQVERLYKIEQLLGEAHTVPIAAMLERLEISCATFKRDPSTLRDRQGAPIVWDRFGGGYRFESQRRTGARHAGPNRILRCVTALWRPFGGRRQRGQSWVVHQSPDKSPHKSPHQL